MMIPGSAPSTPHSQDPSAFSVSVPAYLGWILLPYLTLAAEAGIREGDVLISVGNIAVEDQTFGQRFRQQFGSREGAPLEIKVRRGEQEVTLQSRVRMAARVETRIVETGSPVRIRTTVRAFGARQIAEIRHAYASPSPTSRTSTR